MRSMPKVGYEYVQLEGGLDVVTSPLKIPGGKMTGCRNFEIDQYGGYRRVDGYERFDGQPAPSSATYQYLPATISGALVSGNILTGLISGATGTVFFLLDPNSRDRLNPARGSSTCIGGAKILVLNA